MLLALTRSTSTKICGTRVVKVVNTCASPGVWKVCPNQQIVAGELDRPVHAGNGAGDFAGAADYLVTALQARAVRQLREDDQVAGILRWNETARHDLETSPGQHEQSRIYS